MECDKWVKGCRIVVEGFDAVPLRTGERILKPQPNSGNTLIRCHTDSPSHKLEALCKFIHGMRHSAENGQSRKMVLWFMGSEVKTGQPLRVILMIEEKMPVVITAARFSRRS